MPKILDASRLFFAELDPADRRAALKAFAEYLEETRELIARGVEFAEVAAIDLDDRDMRIVVADLRRAREALSHAAEMDVHNVDVKLP